MLRMIYSVLLYPTCVLSFKLLEGVSCVLPKVFSVCSEASPLLLPLVSDAFSYMRTENIPFFLSDTMGNNTICSKSGVHYGYMTPNPTGSTDITLNENMLWYRTTAYNVLLHELLHSIGLDHTDNAGLMGYAVSENWFGRVVNDDRKLWLSRDDLNGVYNSCFKG